LAQHEIGRRFQFDPAEPPAPKTGAIVTNRPLTTPYSAQVLQVPSGFTATPFATGLVNPRRLLVLPNGDGGMGRNPATGEPIQIKASKKVAFRANKDSRWRSESLGFH
jgi:hypothetical protein